MRELNFKGITFYNANVDSSGNDRLIVHFLDFLTENEIYSGKDVLEQFALAKSRAKKCGMREYHGRDFGGGFIGCGSIDAPRDIERYAEKINQFKN